MLAFLILLPLEVLPAVLPTSLEQAGPPLQAAVPALLPELELTFQQPQVCSVPQGLSQARLPPAELLLPPRQLQQVTLLQVGTSLCRGCRCAQAWERRQDITPCQAGEDEKGDGELGVPACGRQKLIPWGWKEAAFNFLPPWMAGQSPKGYALIL